MDSKTDNELKVCKRICKIYYSKSKLNLISFEIIMLLLYLLFFLCSLFLLYNGSFPLYQEPNLLDCIVLFFLFLPGFWTLYSEAFGKCIKEEQEYIDSRKPLIIRELLSCIDGLSANYSPRTRGGWLNNLYPKDLPMFRANIGDPKIDDRMKGTYKGINFLMFEVMQGFHANGIIGEYAGFSAFKGILFTFDFPRKNKSLVIVRNRDYHFPINVGETITLEDLEFNRIYETSGDDQIEARIVLQPAFIEKLKSFHHKGQKVACCFQDDKCYVAIQTNKDMFELPFWRSVKDIKPYREIVNQIQDILSIIDTLMG